MRTLQIQGFMVLLSLMNACGGGNSNNAHLGSVTGDDFQGKKYFFAWAEALDGFMGNEVRFDARHVGYTFTNQWGGRYEGKTLVNAADVKRGPLLATLDDYIKKLGPKDMFVQYSAGHGVETMLGIGITYKEMRDKILAMKAKEIIIFTMACYSGGLVEAFEKNKADWKKFKAEGRTLFVMSSSQKDQVSYSGPNLDDEEPIKLQGAAGSLFGHALWKAFMGYSDGYGSGGVKDGKLTLGEIRDFVIDQTKAKGQTPSVIGIYDDNLVMSTIPPKVTGNQELAAAQKNHDESDQKIRNEIENANTLADRIAKQLTEIEEKMASAASAELKSQRAALDIVRKNLIENRFEPISSKIDLQGVGGVTIAAPVAGQPVPTGSYFKKDPCFDGIVKAHLALHPDDIVPSKPSSPINAYCENDRQLRLKEIASGGEELTKKRLELIEQQKELMKQIEELRTKLSNLTNDLEKTVNELLGFKP